MQNFSKDELKKLYIPPPSSHKGQNGKLMIIGGSKLFHAASLWSLKVASRILDMVYYSSVPENNELVKQAKEEFRDGIIVSRNKIDNYINEADCVLIGPGLPRKDGKQRGDDDTKELTEGLLKSYPNKKWVIDGGSLQTIDPEVLMFLREPILTPHAREFELLKLKIKNEKLKITIHNSKLEKQVELFARHYNCIVLLKGPTDIVCGPFDSAPFDSAPFDSAQGGIRCVRISGGNAGMTKGGTGDVLAGLAAALYCKNDAFLSAACASYINKKAGESLFKKVGYYFNSSDLVNEIPKVMKKIILP